MDVNTSVISSSLDDLSPLPPHLSTNSSAPPLLTDCFRSPAMVIVSSTFSITYFCCLPVFIYVLYLGFQQWRQQRSIATATTSHSDVFTYHYVAMQIVAIFVQAMFSYGSYINLPVLARVMNYIVGDLYFGQYLFQFLTCVERYVAVVHPITYLGLRKSRWVKIRNTIVGCVWLWCFAWIPVLFHIPNDVHVIMNLSGLVIYLILIAFCSISVLCVLKRPGPGEEGGKGKRVDQTKQRAFNTIMAIMAVLLVRFVGNILFNVMPAEREHEVHGCVFLWTVLWLDLPSSLVIPLLFLHRAGKLKCCKPNNESG